MKIIVTGGAGFIGSHIVDRLLELGHYVVSIDNYSTGKLQNLNKARKSDNFTDVNADIRDKKRIKRYFYGVDMVFNIMASKKTVCIKSPTDDCEINACGTLGLLELAKEYGVKKFIHASTGSVYKEGAIVEDDELEPVSFYGISKLAGESYVRLFSDKIDTLILRYFHVYGERQDDSNEGGVVSIFINNVLTGSVVNIHGSGGQVRQFTHFSDVVKLTTKLAFTETKSGDVFNICNEEKVSIVGLVNRIKKILGSVHITYSGRLVGDIYNFNVSSQKVRNLTKETFKPFDQGLSETIEYYQKSK